MYVGDVRKGERDLSLRDLKSNVFWTSCVSPICFVIFLLWRHDVRGISFLLKFSMLIAGLFLALFAVVGRILIWHVHAQRNERVFARDILVADVLSSVLRGAWASVIILGSMLGAPDGEVSFLLGLMCCGPGALIGFGAKVPQIILQWYEPSE